MQEDQKNKPAQLNERYRQLIKAHLTDLVKGKTERMLDIEDFADQLCIHPTHLSNTIKEVTGISACGVFQLEIGQVAKELLIIPNRKIQDVALILDFEPSQFTEMVQTNLWCNTQAVSTTAHTEIMTIFYSRSPLLLRVDQTGLKNECRTVKCADYGW